MIKNKKEPPLHREMCPSCHFWYPPNLIRKKMCGICLYNIRKKTPTNLIQLKKAIAFKNTKKYGRRGIIFDPSWVVDKIAID